MIVRMLVMLFCCIVFPISALLFAHKRVCGKQRADTNLAIENFNFQSFPSVVIIFVVPIILPVIAIGHENPPIINWTAVRTLLYHVIILLIGKGTHGLSQWKAAQ